MTNLPTNPTKNEIIERYWFEFIKTSSSESLRTIMLSQDNPMSYLEMLFWQWVKSKLESTNAA